MFGDDYQPEGETISELGLPRSVTVIRPSGPKGDQRMYKAGGGDAAMSQKGQTRDQVINQGKKNYVKQRGDAAREDIKRQDAGKASRVNGKIPEFRVQNNSYEPEGEMVEEGKKELSREKRNKMFRRAGNLSREALQGGDKGSEAHKKSGKIVKALNKDAEENNRNDVREETLRDIYEAKKKGLWDNIHAKRERGESPAKPGDEGYPKTLKVESLEEAAPALVGVLAKMAAKKAAVHVAKKSAEKVKDKMGKLLKGDEEEEEG